MNNLTCKYLALENTKKSTFCKNKPNVFYQTLFFRNIVS